MTVKQNTSGQDAFGERSHCFTAKLQPHIVVKEKGKTVGHVGIKLHVEARSDVLLAVR